MRIYAKQIPPEYQESPLFYDGSWPEKVIADGNNAYNSHTTPEYEHINRYLDEMASAWEEANFYYIPSSTGWYKRPKKAETTISELLRDYGFSRNDGKPWSNKQKHEWRLLLEGDQRSEDEATLAALELITGEEWANGTIRGCCQGDWQEIIYPAEYGREWLRDFETEYFNTGTEWIIHDEDFHPEDPDEISGYSVYCLGWNNDLIRAEIAEYSGARPEDVTLYCFNGWARSISYEEVSA